MLLKGDYRLATSEDLHYERALKPREYDRTIRRRFSEKLVNLIAPELKIEKKVNDIETHYSTQFLIIHQEEWQSFKRQLTELPGINQHQQDQITYLLSKLE